MYDLFACNDAGTVCCILKQSYRLTVTSASKAPTILVLNVEAIATQCNSSLSYIELLFLGGYILLPEHRLSHPATKPLKSGSEERGEKQASKRYKQPSNANARNENEKISSRRQRNA